MSAIERVGTIDPESDESVVMRVRAAALTAPLSESLSRDMERVCNIAQAALAKSAGQGDVVERVAVAIERADRDKGYEYDRLGIDHPEVSDWGIHLAKAALAAVPAGAGMREVWQPIESAPLDEPFLGAVKVRNNKSGQCWWEQHVVWIDSETGELSTDTDAGWSAGDYTHWRPLPAPPALATPASTEQEEKMG